MEKYDNAQKRREYNISIFDETWRFSKHHKDLETQVRESIMKTEIIREKSQYVVQKTWKSGDELPAGKITISSMRTLEAARSIWNKIGNTSTKRIGVLNFASATTVGGGVRKGASTQEESLCRISTLYRCLDTTTIQKNYYDVNRACGSRLYENICVYTPDIIVFRNDDKKMDILPEDEWYYVDVFTCPAPNLRTESYNRFNEYDIQKPINISKDELYSVWDKRIGLLLNTAVAKGITHLVLGAWGCGAFRNPPEMVARIFKKHLFPFGFNNIGLGGCFDEVHFAIPQSKYDTNHDTFKQILFDGVDGRTLDDVGIVNELRWF